METIYSERNWLKDNSVSTSSIHTCIDQYSLGVTSIAGSPTGAPILDHTASINFVRAGSAFGMTFKVNNDEEKEAAMKSLSIMIKDIEALREKIIKLEVS